MSHPTRRLELARALRSEGAEVDTVDDGLHLIEHLADAILLDDDRCRPDLLIVDATLYGCTGLSVLEGVRALRWGTPCIVLTDGRWEASARALGATRVFRDSADLTAVCRAARDILSGDAMSQAVWDWESPAAAFSGPG